MSDSCTRWRNAPEVNPRTNRRILLNGPTYAKLARECYALLNVPVTGTDRVSITTKLVRSLNWNVFRRQFTNKLSVAFSDRPTGFSRPRPDEYEINLNDSLRTFDDIRRNVIREMCLLALANKWQYYIVAAGNRTGASAPISKCEIASKDCSECGSGLVYASGSGDFGQLGLGEDVTESSAFKRVDDEPFIQVAAGGLHTVCVTNDGNVVTFGCNDEGALGKSTTDEEECFVPSMTVPLSDFILSVSAGDSHTAALTFFGNVYVWGSFRDANGRVGDVMLPRLLPNVNRIGKIVSGADHVAMLSIDGIVFTMGNWQQGQLGTRSQSFSWTPRRVDLPDKATNVWTGQYCTYCQTSRGYVYVWGLNNYGQLGLPQSDDNDVVVVEPTRSPAFRGQKWASISGGQHHALALSESGRVYSIGRSEYGRLGVPTPTERGLNLVDVPPCVDVSAGLATSYAVTVTGRVYAWGVRLSGEGPDITIPTLVTGRIFAQKKALSVSVGGQHVVTLACDKA